VEPEPILYRSEALAIIGALADILVVLHSINNALRGSDDELDEDDEG
jgi:hypothetical protein